MNPNGVGAGGEHSAGDALITVRHGIHASHHLHLSKLKAALEITALFLADILTVVVLFKLAVHLRTDLLPLLNIPFPETAPSGRALGLWWVFLIWAFFAAYEGLYTKRFSFWDEIRAIWVVAFFATVGVFAISSVGRLEDYISRTVIVAMGVAALAIFPPMRMSAKAILRRMGLLNRRVLILGAGKTGELIARALREEPNYGYDVIGFLDDDPAKVGHPIDGVKVHRGIDLASRYLVRCNVTDLVLAMPGAGKDRVQGIVNELQHRVERILFVPDVFGMSVVGTSLMHFFKEQAVALELKNNLAQPLNYATKLVFDALVGAALLALLAPPFILIALVIRMTSRGPALYRQERVGKRGVLFQCYKFRTMYEDADRRLNEILDGDPELQSEWAACRKLRIDPRVTPVGRFLRVTSLDELPQLLNVILGDMSLVGPRPVTREEIALYYKENARLCLSVRPGITGLWQVSGRSNTNYDYRIALDTWYVRNWNLWLDIVLLLKTARVVLKREGAC